uniref:DLG associated protein 5 n=1 Tax=Pelusios castaneus TaxID=367368 RepID=A0A8C8RB63_9SAUR
MAATSQFANRYRKDLSTETLRTKVARRKSVLQKENRHKQFERSRQFGLADVNVQLSKERGLPQLIEANEVCSQEMTTTKQSERKKRREEGREREKKREERKREREKGRKRKKKRKEVERRKRKDRREGKKKEDKEGKKRKEERKKEKRRKAKKERKRKAKERKKERKREKEKREGRERRKEEKGRERRKEGKEERGRKEEKDEKEKRKRKQEGSKEGIHQEKTVLEKENIPVTNIPVPGRQRTRSFAPHNFVFQPLDGLTTFKVTPMTPSRANAFLTPNLSWKCVSGESNFTLKCSRAWVYHFPFLFRNVLAFETERLMSHCLRWDGKLELDIPEDAKDLIRTTVGQTRLLIAERFKQFEGLVDNCELKRGDKETTCTDLDGFWDMVSFQVEDVNKKFDNLNKLQENGWQPVNSPSKRVIKKKAVSSGISKPKQGAVVRTAARNHIAAIRAAMKEKMKQKETAAYPAAQEMPEEVEKVVFEAGFFRIESPLKSFPGQ